MKDQEQSSYSNRGDQVIPQFADLIPTPLYFFIKCKTTEVQHKVLIYHKLKRPLIVMCI
jgi:hypothetical protein